MAIGHGQQAYGCERVAGKLAPLFPQTAAAKLTPTQGHGEHLLSHYRGLAEIGYACQKGETTGGRQWLSNCSRFLYR